MKTIKNIYLFIYLFILLTTTYYYTTTLTNSIGGSLLG